MSSFFMYDSKCNKYELDDHDRAHTVFSNLKFNQNFMKFFQVCRMLNGTQKYEGTCVPMIMDEIIHLVYNYYHHLYHSTEKRNYDYLLEIENAVEGMINRFIF